MTIRFACTCGQQLAARDEYVGRQVRCTSCSEIMTVPDNSPAPPSARPAGMRRADPNEEDRPRHSRREDPDEEETRSSRSRRNEDEDEEEGFRPRRRKGG